MTRTEFVEKSINGELQLIKFFYDLEKCFTAYKCSITAYKLHFLPTQVFNSDSLKYKKPAPIIE
jgi:hypothetical protein